VKTVAFEYMRAESLDHALALLADEWKPLAGGQSLVPAMAYRIARPERLVDVNGLAELDFVRDGAVGALTRHVTLERRDDVLGEAARHIGHLPIRVRGTTGGSIAHGDPAAELPVVAVALGAQIVVRSLRGERTIGAEDFFVGPYLTLLSEDELVTEVRFPPAEAVFEEFAVRAGDFAIVCICAARVGGAVRIAAGGVGATPLLLDGAVPLETDVYRRELVELLTGRALARLGP
jgi:CO/xanthine dehydrogenase FAD-binding subunit